MDLGISKEKIASVPNGVAIKKFTEFNFLNSKNEDQHTAPNETQSFTSNENHENDSDDLPF